MEKIFLRKAFNYGDTSKKHFKEMIYLRFIVLIREYSRQECLNRTIELTSYHSTVEALQPSCPG